jgi:exodeoxyribonuclease VII large subunit
VQERHPFDPTRARGPRQPATSAARPGLLTVSQVNELVRGAIAAHVPATISVLGEIGDLSRPASGHIYFSLKDERSELRCVLWRSAAATLRFALQTGMQVIATGGIEVYTPRGTYQLIARTLEPRGIGALELAFRQLREKLEREGLFDAARKKPLPKLPARIALVTSPRGTAIRDLLTTLARRYPVADVLLCPVRVQGEGAAEEIAAAIGVLNAQRAVLGGIDLMIVGRGGGSLEDLWAFNEEAVARAIAASEIPVVSAVGHEVDVTISDLVADLRAPTPTAAAELATPHRDELLRRIERDAARVQRVVEHALRLARSQLDGLLAAAPLARPLALIRERAQLVDEHEQHVITSWRRLDEALRRRLTRADLVLGRFAAGAMFARTARQVDARLATCSEALRDRIIAHERSLYARLGALERFSPTRLVAELGARVDMDRARLASLMRVTLAHRRERLESRVRAITACDPRNVLRRGYSLTRDEKTGVVLRSVAQVRPSQRITTEVADGTFVSTTDASPPTQLAIGSREVPRRTAQAGVGAPGQQGQLFE